MALIVKKTPKKNWMIRIIVMIIIGYYILRVMTLKELSEDGSLTFEMFTDALNNIQNIKTPIILNSATLGGALFGAFFAFMVMETYSESVKKTMTEQTYGSAEWGEPKDKSMEKIKSKNIEENIIISKNLQVARNMAISGLNRNYLIVGRSGSGKSRTYFIPQIINANGNSIVVTDPKGELLSMAGESLRKKGYTIKLLDLDRKTSGNHYNPIVNIKKVCSDETALYQRELAFCNQQIEYLQTKLIPKLEENIRLIEDTVQELQELKDNNWLTTTEEKKLSSSLVALEKEKRKLNQHRKSLKRYQEDAKDYANKCGGPDKIAEDDVMSLIDSIMKNTKDESIQQQTGDPFWNKAEMMFLQAIFYYVIFNETTSNQNFTRILDLIRMANPDSRGNSQLKNLFEVWRKKDPKNIGIMQWDHFMASASSPKTMATIILTASARLSPFNIHEVADLTNVDDMEMMRIGQPQNAPKDQYGNRTDGKIAYFIKVKPTDGTFNFIGAIFYSQMFKILSATAEQYHGSCPNAVDLFMDEWANIGEVPDFDKILATVRSLNVGISICIQSLDQLKGRYKECWGEIADSCDVTMFLGGGHTETLKWFSERMGKQTIHKKSTSRTYSRQGSSSKSDDEVGRELATVDELSSMPKKHCIVLMSYHGQFYDETYDLTTHPNYPDVWEPWIEKNENKEHTAEEVQKNHEKLYEHMYHIDHSSDKITMMMICQKYGLPSPHPFKGQAVKLTAEQEEKMVKYGVQFETQIEE